jgi:hypothetical protein
MLNVRFLDRLTGRPMAELGRKCHWLRFHRTASTGGERKETTCRATVCSAPILVAQAQWLISRERTKHQRLSGSYGRRSRDLAPDRDDGESRFSVSIDGAGSGAWTC